ncbi:MAG: HAMP domain-containing histidine kinase [Propionibacteriaceae bacterium]|jgi:signal transduction histidine kinase|nr:HAMP domain-containing histidine kinase [Propionibacteriaceae bacterium]
MASRREFSHTMAFRGWLALLLISLASLLAMGVSQGLFLMTMTSDYQGRAVERSAHRIIANAGADPSLIEKSAYDHGWRILTLSADFVIINRYDGFDSSTRGKTHAQLPSLHEITLIAFDDTKDALLASGQSEISRVPMDRSEGIEATTYLGRFPGGGDIHYLYITSVLSPTEPTRHLLQMEFIIAGLAIALISFFVALVVARNISRPLTSLTASAKRLAQGDFNTYFDGAGFVETEHLASALNYSAKELRTVDLNQKEFLTNVSHDLKTPLTIIKIYAETIRDVTGDNPAKRQAQCDTIIEETNRLTDMVNEVIEISRLESGAANIVMEEIDLATCLEETLNSFAIMAEAEGYTLDTETIGSAPIRGDEHYMKRVLYNLIGNAINYTGDDLYVGIRLYSVKDLYHFEVIDHGPGIPADKLASIWDRYYRSRTPHKRAIIGSGIGLSITRHILTLHHATFGVISNDQGTGSRFWFEIPQLGAEPEANDSAISAD